MMRVIHVEFRSGTKVAYQVGSDVVFLTDIGLDGLMRLHLRGRDVDLELQGIDHITIGAPEQRA